MSPYVFGTTYAGARSFLQAVCLPIILPPVSKQWRNNVIDFKVPENRNRAQHVMWRCGLFRCWIVDILPNLKSNHSCSQRLMRLLSMM